MRIGEVEYAAFARAEDTPDEVLAIACDSRETLVAMSVIREPRVPPRPFPGQAKIGYVADPPGAGRAAAPQNIANRSLFELDTWAHNKGWGVYKGGATMPEFGIWKVTDSRIHKERGVLGKQAITLSHPQYPFVVPLESIESVRDELIKAAAQYLDKIVPSLGLVKLRRRKIKLLDARIGRIGFRWSDASFVFERRELVAERPTGSVLDRSVVLFLVPTLSDKRRDWALGSRTGLRIVGSIWSGTDGKQAIRISGATCSDDFAEFANALDPDNPTLSTFAQYFDPPPKGGVRAKRKTLLELSDAARKLLAEHLQCDPALLYIDGIRPVIESNNPSLLDVFAHIPRSAAKSGNDRAPSEPAQSVSARLELSVEGPSRVTSAAKSPLVVHAVDVKADLFAPDAAVAGAVQVLADPVSQMGAGKFSDFRPNRSAGDLASARHAIAVTVQSAGKVDLEEPGEKGFVVMQSKLVDDKADETKPFRCDPSATPHCRTADFAAVSAYRQAAELFQKIDGFGLARKDVFRFAAKPLLLRYRSTMLQGPGRDGRIVNAQVDFSRPRGQIGDIKPAVLDTLQVRFALADVVRSASRREPIGLAVDPRWSWHEFGHVLLAGATNRLELPFAHSVGDALAAIVNDPLSTLVNDKDLRGATFLWVRINRRHDRQVRHGWSWSGSYHRPQRLDPANSDHRHKGYDSEQILSTSLFRLYRALGGDTVTVGNPPVPDIGDRRIASDFTVYLIMRAIVSLGSGNDLSAQTPEQFVAALLDADAATQGAASGPLAKRLGGCALKVVRWAFEAQGLYANVPPDIEHNAPGLPPDVDIYIDNFRPSSEGNYPRGGYMPVSLDWQPVQNSDRPAWHATPVAMALDTKLKTLTVTVSNRGGNPAKKVAVNAYYVPLDQAGEPMWEKPDTMASKWKWKKINPSPKKKDIAGHAQETFDPVSLKNTDMDNNKGRWLILAEATCAEDPAITEVHQGQPAEDLPCAAGPTRVSWLVAGDNNLGLIVYDNR